MLTRFLTLNLIIQIDKWKKSVSMILRIQMILSVVSYVRKKTLIFKMKI